MKKPKYPSNQYSRLSIDAFKLAYVHREKKQARMIVVKSGAQIDMQCTGTLAKEAMAQDVMPAGGAFPGLRDYQFVFVCKPATGAAVSSDPNAVIAVVGHRYPSYPFNKTLLPQQQRDLAAQPNTTIKIQVNQENGSMYVVSYPATKIRGEHIERILAAIDELEELTAGTRLGQFAKVTNVDDDTITVNYLEAIAAATTPGMELDTSSVGT